MPNKLTSVCTLVLAAMALLCQAASGNAGERLDPPKFVQSKGWKLHEPSHLAESPSKDIVPLMFYDKGGSVPACGLIVASPQTQEPRFIELTRAEPGANFPQCMALVSMVAFHLQEREYIAVEYVSRETREDTDRAFTYLYRDPAKGYLVDEALTEAVPTTPAGSGALPPAAGNRYDGVKAARAAQMAGTFPQWRFLDRDFISAQSSSFAVFENKKTQQCMFAAEAGGATVSLSHTEFAPASQCAGILASSRLEKAGTTYYMAMFQSSDGKQPVAIVSVRPDGKISAETALSKAMTRSGASKSIRDAKASLLNALPY
jgi:hypothetical protein